MLERFHLKSHSIRFHSQTHKLELPSAACDKQCHKEVPRSSFYLSDHRRPRTQK